MEYRVKTYIVADSNKNVWQLFCKAIDAYAYQYGSESTALAIPRIAYTLSQKLNLYHDITDGEITFWSKELGITKPEITTLH